MDKRTSEKAPSNSITSDSGTSTDKDSFAMLVDEGFRAGQRIAKISVVTLISIGIAELLIPSIKSLNEIYSRIFTASNNIKECCHIVQYES